MSIDASAERRVLNAESAQHPQWFRILHSAFFTFDTSMTERNENLKQRTMQFGLRVIRLVESLSPKPAAKVIGHQLLRSATSVGANYRAACRARSPAEFRSRMAVVEEEADESAHWLEMLRDAGIIKSELISDLLREAGELTAIAVASIKTSRRNSK